MSERYIDSKETFKASKGLGKKVAVNSLNNISTGAILWHLVKKHKFAIVSMYAIVLTAVYIFPPLPDILSSLLRNTL